MQPPSELLQQVQALQKKIKAMDEQIASLQAEVKWLASLHRELKDKPSKLQSTPNSPNP